jgi:hypothetical protein
MPEHAKDDPLVVMPEDMFFPIIAEYRNERLRSLSMGDEIVMNGHMIVIAPVGYIAIDLETNRPII